MEGLSVIQYLDMPALKILDLSIKFEQHNFLLKKQNDESLSQEIHQMMELLNHTCSAMNGMDSFINRKNEKMMQTIQRQFSTFPITVNLTDRVLVHQGHLVMITMDRETMMKKSTPDLIWDNIYHLHLFCDSLIISKSEDGLLQFIIALELNKIRITHHSLSGYNHSFQIISDNIDVEFCCKNSLDRLI